MRWWWCRKRWYENNKERLARSQRAYCQQNKEHITEDNTAKTTGNGSTNIGDVIMPRIRNGSGMTKSKENYGRTSCGLGPGTKTL